MLILGLLGMYFDDAVVFVTNSSLFVCCSKSFFLVFLMFSTSWKYLPILVSASDQNQNSGFGRTLDASIEGKTFNILNDVKKIVCSLLTVHVKSDTSISLNFFTAKIPLQFQQCTLGK